MIFPHEMQMTVRALESDVGSATLKNPHLTPEPSQSDVGSATLKKSHNLLPAYLFHRADMRIQHFGCSREG